MICSECKLVHQHFYQSPSDLSHSHKSSCIGTLKDYTNSGVLFFVVGGGWGGSPNRSIKLPLPHDFLPKFIQVPKEIMQCIPDIKKEVFSGHYICMWASLQCIWSVTHLHFSNISPYLCVLNSVGTISEVAPVGRKTKTAVTKRQKISNPLPISQDCSEIRTFEQ